MKTFSSYYCFIFVDIKSEYKILFLLVGTDEMKRKRNFLQSNNEKLQNVQSFHILHVFILQYVFPLLQYVKLCFERAQLNRTKSKHIYLSKIVFSSTHISIHLRIPLFNRNAFSKLYYRDEMCITVTHRSCTRHMLTPRSH